MLPGMAVRMVGLQARPELNGQVGVLVKQDATTNRWQVRRGRDDMLLKGANLEPAGQVEPGEGEPKPEDIELLLALGECSRDKVVAALKANNNNCVEAAFDLTGDAILAMEPEA